MNINYYCVISAQTYDVIVLNRFYSQLKTIISLLDINLSGPVKLPTVIRKITVLRSPHIDKKAREQFEQRLHKQVFFFGFSNVISLVLFKYIVKTKISGIFFKVTTITCVNSSIG